MLSKPLKTDWLIGLLSFFVVLLASETNWLRGLEYAAYDLAMQLSPRRTPAEEVVVVAIDEPSLQQFGPWPWSRDVLARAQRRLTEAGPGVVAYTLSFEAAHNERGLQLMAEFRDTYGAQMGRSLRRLLQSAVNRLDTDHALGTAFSGAGHVVLGLGFEPLAAAPAQASPLPARLRGEAITVPAALPRVRGLPDLLQPPGIAHAGRLYLPIEKIAAGALGLAPDPADAIGRGAFRAVPLVVRHGEVLLPTLALRVLAAYRGLGPAAIDLDRRGVSLGGTPLAADFGGRVHPYFYPAQRGESSLTIIPIAELLAGRVDADALRGKLVLVGLTAPRFAPAFRTPLGVELPAVMVLGHTLSALLRGDVYALTSGGLLLRLALLALTGCYLMLVVPRLRTTTSLVLSGLLVVLLLNAEYFALLLHAIWLPLVSSIVLLAGGHLLLGANRALQRRLQSYQHALSDSNRLLGQTLQAQGQLDEAFAKYRHCSPGEEVLGLLYNLGLDFERKRQFNKAADVFTYLSGQRRRYRDAEERVKKNRQLDSRLLLGRNNQQDTLIITGAGVQNPVLGRYEVEKEIGRGAMGMVYLGRDPKIGRTVAIKTMALDQEFEAENLVAVKERFFREAETAGRLKHPHIVTIYDVGEEQELCYIAMDFIAGRPMSEFTEEGKLLPVARVLDVAAQVADALHYAHINNVVHRDIKPGNIMYDADARHATVTDFGVACLTDASRTKTGTILGSPSYMSPEQLAGERVDGRADLFSLGVTLFQLLTAQLPFVADSLSALMYRIANEPHPDPLKLRPRLPAPVRSIVNRALHKDPEKRYKNGEQMAAALRRGRDKGS